MGNDQIENEKSSQAILDGALFDNLPVGVVVFSADGKVLKCNLTAAAFFQLNREEIEGRRADDVPFRFFYEDGSVLPVEKYPYNQVLSSGKRLDGFVMRIHPNHPEAQRSVRTHTYPEFDQENHILRVVMVMTSIVQQNAIETKLREEELFTRSLMENIPYAIYFKDRDSRFLRVNNAQAASLGLDDPAMAFGKTDFDFFSEEHSRIAFQDEQEIINCGKPLVAKEEKLTFPDGRIVWVSTTKMPLTDPDGKILGTFGVSYDITKRKFAEEQLAESEHRFRTLFEGAAVGVAMMETKTGNFLRVNRKFCDMLGYSEEELMKLSFIDLTTSDDVQESIEHMKKLVAGKVRDYSLEKRYVKKDGSIVYAHLSVSPMWSQGEEPTNHIAVAEDITKRKLAEEAERASRVFLENLIDHANAPIITWDTYFRITLINHTFEKLIGIKSEEILGKSLEILFPEDSREKSMERVGHTINGAQFDGVELPILQKNGGVRLVEWNTSNLFQDDGRTLLATIAHGKDITERYQAEQSLLQHTFELEMAQNFSRSLHAAQTVSDLLEIFIKNVITQLSLSSGMGFLEEGELKTPTFSAGQGWLQEILPKTLSKADGVVGQVYSSQKPMGFESYFSDIPCLVQDHPEAHDQGGVCIPFVSDGEMIGLAFFDSTNPKGFHDEEIRLIVIMAEIVTNAIKRTKLRNELEISYSDLEKADANRRKIQELLAREKEMLSFTLMSIGDGLIRVDSHGLINLYNKSAEVITEYQATEALGHPLEDVFKLLDFGTNQPMEGTIEKLLELERLEKDNPEYQVQTMLTRTGKRILVSGSISPLMMSGGTSPGYVLAFRDVSEKHSHEAQTALSHKMEAIGQLAAGIAHEINTPIQYIGDNINFLQRSFARFGEILKSYNDCLQDHIGKNVTPEEISVMEALFREKKIEHYLSEVPDAIQESQEGIERVRKIVVAIREFSHASDQEMRLADINRAISTTVTISRNEWKYLADLETDFEQDLPQVYCQVDEINQVVLNMIVNAAQAIQPVLEKQPGGKGKIKISTRSGDGKVLISISDSGSGIPESIRDRIFDPFFTTKEVGKGTGQGLALAHNIIIKKHHGRIFVDSEPGKGTTFTIELYVENPMENAR